MNTQTRPFLAVYVVWHPGFTDGSRLGESLREHFRRKLYENVAGGTGLSVVFRSVAPPGSAIPLSINLDEAETTAVVVLADATLVGDQEWVGYVRDLATRADGAGLRARVFPVTLDRVGLQLELAEQALRWDEWIGTRADLLQRLITSSPMNSVACCATTWST